MENGLSNENGLNNETGDIELEDLDELLDDDLEEDLEKFEEADTEDQVDIVAPTKKRHAVAKDERTTSKVMTRYEKARILGARSLQISMGATVNVPLDGETDSLRIAIKELKQRKIPMKIRRHLPDGSFETWEIKDMEVPDL